MFNRPTQKIFILFFSVFLIAMFSPAIDANAALNATNFFPAIGATNVCADTTLKITFDAPPTFSNAGTLRIYAAGGTLIDTITLSSSTQTRVVAGSTFNYYPILINSNTATIVFHSNELTNNQTYYVTIDPTVFTNSTSGAYAGISITNGWYFTTKPAHPATGTNYLVIAADGSGDFCTVQGAVDFLPSNNTNPVLLFVRDGLYQEIVRVNGKNNLTFRGEDRKQSIISYANDDNLNSGSAARTMLAVNANDIALENLTLTNSTPKGGSQAEAVNTTGQRDLLFNCDCDSFQDTLKLDGTTYLQDCYVQGDTDYMWGYGASYFTNCETRALNPGYNCQVRNPGTIYGFVFVNCQLTKAPTLASNTFWLNRTDSKVTSNGDSNVNVIYISCAMDNHIEPAGWLNQFPSGVSTAGLRLWEYQSTMLGTTNLVDISQRASFSQQLSDAEALLYSQPTNIFGGISNGLPVGNGWMPQFAPDVFDAPTNQIIETNQTALFNVGAGGIPAPAFQWLKNGTNISDATNDTLTVSNAQSSDTGIYSVVVSNTLGAVTNSASLLVNPLAQPQVGPIRFSNGQFSLSVNDGAGLNYSVQVSTNLAQWQTVFSTNSPPVPFNWTDSDAVLFPMRYYRVAVGPPTP